MIITIDGPAASGKSTVARELARRLGYHHLSTGLLYRGLAYLLITMSDYNEVTIAQPSEEEVIDFLDPEKFSYFEDVDSLGHVSWDGKDITHYLKTPEIDTAASLLSSNPMVREYLLEYQRWFGDTYDMVADGRDLGSVVYPNADVKFFLTAQPEERARRWLADQVKKGNALSLQQALTAVNERDSRDRERAVCPLIQPADAIIVDNTDLAPQQTLDAMMAIIQQKID
ncbi:MAG: (d)CMP kinase [Candidatus Babeliales bacterium]